MKLKTADWIGIAFIVLFVLLVIFFPFNYGVDSSSIGKLLDKASPHFFWAGFSTKGLENFGNVTKQFPYIMGFLKFATLAMFGEMLKQRMKTGSWAVSKFPVRVIVWGIFGCIMALAFGIFGTGMGNIMGDHLWFGSNIHTDKSFWNTLLFAISTSVWMNLIFAYPMMLAHEWANSVIAAGRFIGGAAFLEGLNKQAWGSFIPKSIVWFWMPAHTVTFLLPAEYRVLMGAALGVALGFILTIHSARKA